MLSTFWEWSCYSLEFRKGGALVSWDYLDKSPQTRCLKNIKHCVFFHSLGDQQSEVKVSVRPHFLQRLQGGILLCS